MGSTLKVFALSKSSSLPHENPQVHSIPRLCTKQQTACGTNPSGEKKKKAKIKSKKHQTQHLCLCRFIAKGFVLSSVHGHKWKRSPKPSQLPQGRLGKAFLHHGYLSPRCDWSQQLFRFCCVTCFRAKACLPSPLLLSLCSLASLWWYKAIPENSSGCGCKTWEVVVEMLSHSLEQWLSTW